MHGYHSSNVAPLSSKFTVETQVLKNELQARIDKINLNVTDFLVEVDAAIAKEADYVAKVEKWYQGVAKGLRRKDFEVDPTSGKLVSAPGSSVKVPLKPTRGRLDNEAKYVKQVRELIEREHKRAIEPLQNAIDVLNLTTQIQIEIDTGNYQSLLAISYEPSWDYHSRYWR